MNTFYYFLQSLPESMGLIALSLALAKVPLRWGRIVLGGVLISVVSYIIRALPVTFGLHMPVIIFILFMFINRLTDVKPSRTVLAVCASFFVLAVLEYLVSTAFFAITKMDPAEALANETLWSYVGLIQSTLLIVIAVLLSRFFKPVQGVWKK